MEVVIAESGDFPHFPGRSQGRPQTEADRLRERLDDLEMDLRGYLDLWIRIAAIFRLQ